VLCCDGEFELYAPFKRKPVKLLKKSVKGMEDESTGT